LNTDCVVQDHTASDNIAAASITDAWGNAIAAENEYLFPDAGGVEEIQGSAGLDVQRRRRISHGRRAAFDGEHTTLNTNVRQSRIHDSGSEPKGIAADFCQTKRLRASTQGAGRCIV